MKQYWLSMYQPDGDPPSPEVLEPIMRDLDALRQEMQAAAHHSSVKRWPVQPGQPPSTPAAVPLPGWRPKAGLTRDAFQHVIRTVAREADHSECPLTGANSQ
jgi:hypothetical protein